MHQCFHENMCEFDLENRTNITLTLERGIMIGGTNVVQYLHSYV